MNQSSAILYLLLCSLFSSSSAFAQISGVVNQYVEVLSIDNVTNSVEVSNATSFTTSDRVLLIQMKGAIIDESNSANFGDVINLNNAGAYEMATVCDVVGNDILFSYEFENTYDPANGRVQLISVYSGTDETVNATLTAAPWNGTTGGVVAIELSGTLTLNADIDVSEQGFRGATAYQTGYACNIGQSINYFYPFNAGNGRAGAKGEGIANFIANKEYGKGHQGNGGGGGNDHNAGGGGGANYAAGGQGGTRVTGSIFCRGNHPGLGGEALSTYAYSLANNHILMGGGGGAGESNNNQTIDAGNGGGIVIIIADQIEGNGNFIRSNGGSVAISGSDGGSGGGAGGTIILSTNGYGISALELEAIGGTGGSNSIGCEGPGGGGAGGVIWTASALTGAVNTNVSGGAAGIATGGGCGSSTNGATAGGNGVVQNALTIPEEIVNLSPCVLNTSSRLFGEFTPQQEVRLSWGQLPYDQIENIYVERQNQTGVFLRLTELEVHQSEWIDTNPEVGENIYRLKFINRDATLSYSNQTSLYIDLSQKFTLTASPNPINKAGTLSISYQLPHKGDVRLSLWDLPGRQIIKKELLGEAGNNQSFLEMNGLPIGTYFLKVDFQGKSEIYKIFVQD